MKCVDKQEVPKSKGMRFVNLDGGVLGHVDGDPKDTAEHFFVRYAGGPGKPDTLKTFER